MNIQLSDLSEPAIAVLLAEHQATMAATSPKESQHALDLAGLRRPEISFWCVWEEEQLVGCGALKELDATHAEIKSMRTAKAHLRQGVASLMLKHLLAEAKRRGYQRVSLETGAQPLFEAARRLYERFGFETCPPFADYVEDPHSVFMTREV